MMMTTMSALTAMNLPMAAKPGLLLPGVLYLDDLLDEFKHDDIGLPPVDDEDDGDDGRPHCVYEYGGYTDEDDDFADLYDTERNSDYGCRETPEYYIKALSKDPGATSVETFYYCPRHFAINIGYLADVMARCPQEWEIDRYVNNGEIPPRFALQDWGRIGE
ncbi:hypothetical protein [Bifidobacterium saguinibicoloris]|uniref:hypothetical protein n=1 Tax=Bifidobacterium saguinibicoloris TaxID=2834433 RepID=UPI001C55C983|nr:hypothetical protein [Bifidobacterium saguinibicoloris]MBW3080728.1 hypothetical protein [Bifidobacterium saguinibicoloris]